MLIIIIITIININIIINFNHNHKLINKDFYLKWKLHGITLI